MTNKISLYQVRSFSEKFSATFDFARQNWRLFVRLSLYLLLPLSILQGIFANSYYSSVLRDFFVSSRSDYSDAPLGAAAMVGIVSLLSFIVVPAITYTVMKRYEQSDADISSLTFHELWPAVKKNIGRSALVLLAYLLVYIAFAIAVSVVGVFAIFSAFPFGGNFFFFFLVFAAIVAILPPQALFPAVYLLEEDALLWPSLRKAVVYGFKTWGGLFALLFVLSIIVGSVSYFVVLPGLIVSAFKETLFPATFIGSGLLPLLYTVLNDVLLIAGLYVSSLLSAIPLIALGFHYGHAAETIDHVSVAEEINHFDDLADDGDDAGEEPSAPASADDAPQQKDDIDNFNNI